MVTDRVTASQGSQLLLTSSEQRCCFPCVRTCTHTDTDRHRHTDTDTQTHRHRHTQTHTHTHTQTDRHRHTDTQTHRHMCSCACVLKLLCCFPFGSLASIVLFSCVLMLLQGCNLEEGLSAAQQADVVAYAAMVEQCLGPALVSIIPVNERDLV